MDILHTPAATPRHSRYPRDPRAARFRYRSARAIRRFRAHRGRGRGDRSRNRPLAVPAGGATSLSERPSAVVAFSLRVASKDWVVKDCVAGIAIDAENVAWAIERVDVVVAGASAQEGHRSQPSDARQIIGHS